MNLSFLVSGSVDTTLKSWKIEKDNDGDSIKVNVAFTVKAHEKDINSAFSLLPELKDQPAELKSDSYRIVNFYVIAVV